MANEADKNTMLAEFNDQDYCKDVLQLDQERTEDLLDQELINEAATFGIEVPRPSKAHISVCDSTATVESRHARTGSTASRTSLSTNATSRSSSDGKSRPSASFSSYDRFIEQAADAPDEHPLPPAPEPAPSIFSVSTRKSYSSIKSGITNRFRGLRRKKTSSDILK